MWIDGKEVPAAAGGKLEVMNPATGAHLCYSAEGRAEDVETAVSAAKRAFEDGRWSQQTPRARAKVKGEIVVVELDIIAHNTNDLFLMCSSSFILLAYP